MTDSNIQNDPLKLYRQYQETRDDIHPTVFNALREKAHAESNEDAIYELIQIAKTSQNSQNILESNSTFEEKKSWFNKLFNRSNNAAPQMGMAVACMVFVVFLVPIAMNSGNKLSNFSSTAHLSDCGECIAYVANASVSTRGANSRGLTKEQKQSTQLGLVSGKLQVLAATSREEPNSVLSLIKADIAKLPQGLMSDNLKLALKENDVNLKELNSLLSKSAPIKGFYNVSAALFIANVSTRRALETGTNEGLSISIDNSITELKTLENLTPYQLNRVKVLRTYQDKGQVSSELLYAIEQLSSSLGA